MTSVGTCSYCHKTSGPELRGILVRAMMAGVGLPFSILDSLATRGSASFGRGRAALLGLGLALALSSCSSTVRELEIADLEDVRVERIGGREAQLDVALAFRNPRSLGARVDDASFDLSLGAGTVATGRLTSPVEMKGHEVVRVRVPFQVEYDRVTDADMAALFEPQVKFHVRGQAHVKTTFGSGTVVLDADGMVAAPDRLRVVVEDESAAGLLSVRGAGLGQLGIEKTRGILRVGVRNPFSFALPLDRFRYQVEMNGRPLASGVSKPGPLKPGRTVVDIPVDVQPVAAALGTAAGLLESVLGRTVPAIGLRGELVVQRGAREITLECAYDGPVHE